MPWSDDTRCLFCDGKLPLYRKLAQGQFCSKAHQDAYWKEQEQLAVAVLHRTHDALQAYKPAVPAESILGPEPSGPEPSQPSPLPEARPSEEFVGVPKLQGLQRQPGLDRPIAPSFVAIVAADPVEYEIAVRAVTPAVHFGVAGPDSVIEEDAPVAGLVSLAYAIAESSSSAALPAFEAMVTASLAVRHPSLQPQAFADLSLSAAVALPGAGPRDSWHAPRAHEIEFRVEPVRETAYVPTPAGGAMDQLERDAFPQVETLCALAGVRAAVAAAPVRDLSAMEAFPASSVSLPGSMDAPNQEYALDTAGTLLRISEARACAPVLAAVEGEIAPLELHGAGVELGLLRLEPLSADPGYAPMAALSAEPEARDSAAASYRAVMFQAFVPEIAALLPDPAVCAAVTAGPEVRAFAENVLPLDTMGRIEPRAAFKLRPGLPPEPLTGELVKPRSKMAPVAPKYSASGLLSGDAMALNGDAHGLHRMAAGAVAFWNHAPRDLKILLFLVPLALGLAFHPSLPKVSVKATQPDTEEVTGQFQQVLDTQWANLRKSIADRAAVGLDENFRQGLDSWMSNSGSVAEWTYDQAGFVQPGRVALYQPSLGLSDYEFQFLGAIDKGALSWVTRAVDFQNYYVVKLTILKGGPIPQLGITRYAVIGGKPVDRVDTPVHLNTRTDSLYRVAMELQGDKYSLSIQGQMIDSWTEPRLKRGGVGFFTNRGEQSRIGWVQITHQYDMLGRLFAYLAP